MLLQLFGYGAINILLLAEQELLLAEQELLLAEQELLLAEQSTNAKTC
jgi:hypothetical protein